MTGTEVTINVSWGLIFLGLMNLGLWAFSHYRWIRNITEAVKVLSSELNRLIEDVSQMRSSLQTIARSEAQINLLDRQVQDHETRLRELEVKSA